MKDEFEVLAAKVLAGEASAEERARLEELLSQSMERRQEYAGLEAAWTSLKATAPIAQALDAPPATIPEQRLRQLQKVVREKAHGASTVATPKKPSLAPSASDESMSALGAFRRWLQGRTGVSPVPLCVAGLMVLCAASLVFWLLQPAKTVAPAQSANEPAAYLIVQRGATDVIRAGTLLPATSAATLRLADELRLAPAAQATLLTRTGAVAVAGPLRSAVSSLVPDAGQPGSDARLDKFQIALFKPASELLNAGLLVATRNARTIPLYSPAGATAKLTPPILWKNEPGKTYDLAIMDEFDAKMPQWRARGVTSPLEFGKVEAWKGRALAKDGLYRVRISESDRPLTACDYTFRTAENAGKSPVSETADPLPEAVQILTTAPSRVGDALALLLRLPPEQADTELAHRFKLLLFGQLGYQADFEAALARLQTVR